jgi:hypothetical protein
MMGRCRHSVGRNSVVDDGVTVPHDSVHRKGVVVDAERSLFRDNITIQVMIAEVVERYEGVARHPEAELVAEADRISMVDEAYPGVIYGCGR